MIKVLDGHIDPSTVMTTATGPHDGSYWFSREGGLIHLNETETAQAEKEMAINEIKAMPFF